jgi:hypothetical protein
MKTAIIVASWIFGFIVLNIPYTSLGDALDLRPSTVEVISIVVAIVLGIGANYVGQWLRIKLSGDHADYAHLYAKAEEEVHNGTYDRGLWSKALVRCNGDESKRKVSYMTLRVAILRKKEEEQGQTKQAK